MKKLFTLAFVGIFTLTSLSSFAYGVINPLKEKNSKEIMVRYLQAIVLGSDAYNAYLFSKDFQYSNTANNDVYSKKEYLKFLKATKGLKFNCKVDYKILDETGNSCVAKAIMEFENFTRLDYITICKTEDGWKVSKVITTYP